VTLNVCYWLLQVLFIILDWLNLGCCGYIPRFVVVIPSALAGPRFDASNSIISHSILGDVEEFLSQAVQRGDICEVRHFKTVDLTILLLNS